ncbi:hypothetical protein M0R45_001656 [Rubus argutus]|uniref:Uncharacterized protein n=1 Tax=Rubus argutus TaxID=59490 RepID=A0AAW1VLK7_RUBAR
MAEEELGGWARKGKQEEKGDGVVRKNGGGAAGIQVADKLEINSKREFPENIERESTGCGLLDDGKWHLWRVVLQRRGGLGEVSGANFGSLEKRIGTAHGFGMELIDVVVMKLAASLKKQKKIGAREKATK